MPIRPGPPCWFNGGVVALLGVNPFVTTLGRYNSVIGAIVVAGVVLDRARLGRR